MQPGLLAISECAIHVPQRRRHDDPDAHKRPDYYQIQPGLWAVVHYALSPKNGWATAWQFPMFWADQGRWIAPHINGEAPDGTLLWGSREDAQFDLEHNYPPDEPFRAGRLSYPSYDQRRSGGR